MSIQQAGRPLRISTPLPTDAVLIEKLSGSEAISGLFQFELDLLIQPELLTDTFGASAAKYLAFEKLLGQSVTVTLDYPQCPTRYFNGILVQLSEGLPVTGSAATTLWQVSAVLAPKLWLLGRGLRSRVFQQKSVKDILQKVLKTEYRLDCTLSLALTYDARPLCLQYQESDLAFVSRLMEEEGIRYYFTHEDGKHTLILNDTTTGYPALSSNRITTTGWRKRQSVQPGHYQVRDHTLLMTGQTLAQTRALTDKVQIGPIEQKLNVAAANGVYHYQPEGSFAHRRDVVNRQGVVNAQETTKVADEGSRAADLEMQRAACRAIDIEGTSNATQALPGYLFQLEGSHPQATGKYLFTAVEHRADLKGIYTDRPQAALLYENRFESLPETLPYRPQLNTPCPPMQYPLTATVVADGANQAGDVINDCHGRVKVRFHWDAAEDANTCWLWVAQAWAGNSFGAYFMPRVGNDVLVSFVNGRRDRPLITGSVHSDANLPPFWDGANQSVVNTVQGIRTKSVLGGPNDYSMFAIDDKSNNELMSLRANRDFIHETVNDSTVKTGNDSSTTTGNNHDERVGKDLTSTVASDADYQVGGNRYEIIGYDGWFKAFPGFFPSNQMFTYGNRVKMSCPLETDINFGSHGYVLVDPLDYMVNKTIPGSWVWTRRILTAFGGKTDVLYGNETRIMYGSLAKNFCRGQMINSVLSFRGGEKTLAGLSLAHLMSLGLTVFLPLIRAKVGKSTALDLAINIAGLAVTATQVLLKVAEKYYRAASIAEELTETGEYLTTLGATLTWDAPAITAIGTLLTAHAGQLTQGKSGVMHQEVEGNYCLQAGQALLISEGNFLILARRHDVKIVGDNVTLTAPKTTINSTTFEVQNTANSIKMDAASLTLAVGPTSKIEVTNDHIKLTCGASSVEITPAKIARLSQLLPDQAVAHDVAH